MEDSLKMAENLFAGEKFSSYLKPQSLNEELQSIVEQTEQKFTLQLQKSKDHAFFKTILKQLIASLEYKKQDAKAQNDKHRDALIEKFNRDIETQVLSIFPEREKYMTPKELDELIEERKQKSK